MITLIIIYVLSVFIFFIFKSKNSKSLGAIVTIICGIFINSGSYFIQRNSEKYPLYIEKQDTFIIKKYKTGEFITKNDTIEYSEVNIIITKDTFNYYIETKLIPDTLFSPKWILILDIEKYKRDLYVTEEIYNKYVK